MKYVLGMLVTMLLAISVQAQTIKIVSNLPAGSAPDTVTRRLAEVISAKWNTPIVVDNRPGAAGAVALEHYLNEPADSNTILMLDGGAWSTMPILYNKEDRFARLQTLAPLYSNEWVLIANSRIKSLDDLRSAIKTRPFYGSWGIGSAGHFCGIEVARVLGVTATHVPYKEYGQWFADVVNGELAYSCSSIGSTEQYRNSGKLNWLALTARERDPGFPEIPTTRELLGPEFHMNSAFITFFIHDTAPSAKVRLIRAEIARALQTPEMREALKFVRGKSWAGTHDEFDRFIVKTIVDNRRLIRQADIRVN
jgi:tripartite-type tricarboxylate transporter receptor subunit TctC